LASDSASEKRAAAALFSNVKTYIPGKTMLVLAAISCALTLVGIAINYFRAGRIEFAHCVLALGLLAFVVWFSGRKQYEDE
jgi:hypothetical protein